jgi:aminoglycoside phosphotransferase (APT) family kinase protein
MRDEIEIDESLVRSLLREQHPDLAGLGLRRVVAGWDNEMWRLGEDLAVRLPRTPRAPGLLRNEHRWLPVLAPRLPLPVPMPVRAGEPSERFPWPWTVITWVPGEPGDLAPIGRGDHAAATLAAFLRALHGTAPPPATEVPANPQREADLTSHARGVEEGARSMDGALDGLGPRLREVWEDAVNAPAWDGPPVWLHADLHPANILVTDGTLAGVIDFGDLCVGDPATDLSAAWVLLPAGAAAAFLAAYGPVDEATIRRARGWAVMRGLGLISIGLAGERGLPGGKPTWLPAGRAALHRALA